MPLGGAGKCAGSPVRPQGVEIRIGLYGRINRFGIFIRVLLNTAAPDIFELFDIGQLGPVETLGIEYIPG